MPRPQHSQNPRFSNRDALISVYHESSIILTPNNAHLASDSRFIAGWSSRLRRTGVFHVRNRDRARVRER